MCCNCPLVKTNFSWCLLMVVSLYWKLVAEQIISKNTNTVFTQSGRKLFLFIPYWPFDLWLPLNPLFSNLRPRGNQDGSEVFVLLQFKGSSKAVHCFTSVQSGFVLSKLAKPLWKALWAKGIPASWYVI